MHTRPRWQRESLPPVLRSPRLASHCTQHLAMKTVRHPLYDRGHFMVFMKFKDSCDKTTADPLLMDLMAGVMNCCAQRTLQKHDILGIAICEKDGWSTRWLPVKRSAFQFVSLQYIPCNTVEPKRKLWLTRNPLVHVDGVPGWCQEAPCNCC